MPLHVFEQFLNLQSGKSSPVLERSARPAEIKRHYENDDCRKNSRSGDLAYNSDKQNFPRRESLGISSPKIEYRQAQGSYQQADAGDYSSHEDPRVSTGYDSRSYPSEYDSKSYPSQYESKSYPSEHESKSYPAEHESKSKSHSSGSYTQSKSTSSSRTTTPNRVKPKVHVFGDLPLTKNENNRGHHSGNKEEEIVVYKVRDEDRQRPNGYNDHSHPEYQQSPPPSKHRMAQYSVEHAPGVRTGKPAQGSQHRRPADHRPVEDSIGHHENRPVQYGPPQDHGNYEQSSYPSDDRQNYRQEYIQQDVHPSHQHQQEFNPQSEYTDHSQGNYRKGKDAVVYVSQQPEKKRSRKNHRNRNANYEAGIETKLSPGGNRYNNQPQEHVLQSSRQRAERPQVPYDNYPADEIQVQREAQNDGYHRNQNSKLLPSELQQPKEYIFQATPNEVGMRHEQNNRGYKTQHRHPARAVRSSSQHLRPRTVEARAQFPDGNVFESPTMVSKESKPYVSRSVSYSESSYNMKNNGQSEPKSNKPDQQARQYDEPQNLNGEIQKDDASDLDFQTSYKPFNSEYPASYANDQNHNGPQEHPRIMADRPYGEQRQHYDEGPYDGPSEQGPYAPGPEGPYGPSSAEPEAYGPGPSEHGPYTPADHGPYEGNYGPPEGPLEGYQEDIDNSEPLQIDDKFFEKYEISKNAKIIVAQPVEPNLFLADGRDVVEGGHSDDDEEPAQIENYEAKEHSEEEIPHKRVPQGMRVPKEIPGSFSDLVNSNPRFLRKLPKIMSSGKGGFVSSNADDSSIDDLDFRSNMNEPKALVSKGELVQQHGDGVSRIVFNVPKARSKASASTKSESYSVSKQDRNDENLQEAKSEN
ncbi:hypothetical protein X975_20154, partial [Stegodyphus mimosarum]